MNTYDIFWSEKHEVRGIEANSREEAEVLAKAHESEITLKGIFDYRVIEKCKSHNQEINDDNPCFQCLKEAAEERAYEAGK